MLPVLLCLAEPAAAQGLLDLFFGNGSGSKPVAQKPQYLTPGGRPYQASSVFAAPVQRWSSYDGKVSGGGGQVPHIVRALVRRLLLPDQRVGLAQQLHV